MKRLGLFVLLVLWCAGVLVRSASAEPAKKIAYIDIGKLFDNYDKTKDQEKLLQQNGNQKQEARDKLVADIKKLKDEMELLSDKGKEQRQAQVDDKIKRLQEFDREAQAGLRQERDEMMRELLKEIERVVEEYGKANGFQMILDSRVLLYSESGLEVTDAVLKTLNDRYRKKP